MNFSWKIFQLYVDLKQINVWFPQRMPLDLCHPPKLPSWRRTNWPLQQRCCMTCLALSKALLELFINSTGPRMCLVNLHSQISSEKLSDHQGELGKFVGGEFDVVQKPRVKGVFNWAMLDIHRFLILVSSMYGLWKPVTEPLSNIGFVPKFGSQDDVLSQNFLFFYNPQSYGLELLKNMDVSKNNGTPKSSILIGFSIINHPFWGSPILGNPYE